MKATKGAWIHNNDFFYSLSDSDIVQVKGNGSINLNDNFQYITVSYIHFWDSGKMSLCGMKSESENNWISYHYNWFDHSESRHPRIRTISIHVYNNYFNGINIFLFFFFWRLKTPFYLKELINTKKFFGRLNISKKYNFDCFL